jgi:DNA-binding transcriptional ArsR family regulator
VRPLFHPAAEDITVEGVLHALADPVRVHIYDQILRSECPMTCSAFLEVREQAVPKSTLSQHFKVLRDAGLIRSERKGVEMHSVARHADLDERFGELIDAVLQAHRAQNTRIRRQRAKRKARA